MFPEGAPPRGRALLPFKTCAFRAAVSATVAVVPIVCSTMCDLKLNR